MTLLPLKYQYDTRTNIDETQNTGMAVAQLHPPLMGKGNLDKQGSSCPLINQGPYSKHRQKRTWNFPAVEINPHQRAGGIRVKGRNINDGIARFQPYSTPDIKQSLDHKIQDY